MTLLLPRCSRVCGLTVLESLTCILICFLLLVVVIPVGLANYRTMKATGTPLTELIGIKALDKYLKKNGTIAPGDAKPAEPETPPVK